MLINYIFFDFKISLMNPKRRLTNKEKVEIMLKHSTKSYGLISDEMNIPKSTIYFFIRRFKNTGDILNLKSTGAPKKISNRKLAAIETYCKRTEVTNLRQIKEKLNLNISNRTLSKYLKKINIRRYSLHNKPKIKGSNKFLRKEFSQSMINKSSSYLNRLAFTDECSISLNTFYKRKIWRKKGTFRYNERSKVFSLQYIKVYGIITYEGIGSLLITNKPFNSIEYCRLISEAIIDKGIGNKYKFVHDNDTVHNSQYTTNFLRNKGIKFVNFPPEFPEGNIIENCWSQLKRKIFDKPFPKTINELKLKTQNCWNQISLEYIRSLYGSLRRRFQMVIDRNGDAIKY